MSEKKTAKRTRNFTCLVYPDSAPEDWREILESLQMQVLISPIHDKDVNENAQGEFKKAHYHIILMFTGPKTVEQAHEIMDTFGGVYPPEIPRKSSCMVQDIRGASRYLCHLDNPGKAQYSVSDVVQYGGVDYHAIIELASDFMAVLDEIEDFCEQNNIFSFYVLSKYCRKFKPEWSRVLRTRGSVYLREVLTSKRWSYLNDEAYLYDKDTGEIIV